MSRARGRIGTVDRELAGGMAGGSGEGFEGSEGEEGEEGAVEAAMEVAETDVRHICGGPAALPTALLTESGAVRCVYFGDPPSTIPATETLDRGWAMGGGAAGVVGASLGWQHALLLVK